MTKMGKKSGKRALAGKGGTAIKAKSLNQKGQNLRQNTRNQGYQQDR